MTRIYIILIYFIISHLSVLADIPDMPLKVKLTTNKLSYIEGETINFTISIFNTSQKNTHPILLPNAKNLNKKVFYFFIADASTNYYHEIEIETREFENSIQNKFTVDNIGIIQLKPHESVSFDVCINGKHTENTTNHSLNTHLLFGNYRFYLLYNPSGTAVGDSLYNFYDLMTTQSEENSKLYIPTSGILSVPLNINIEKSLFDTIKFNNTEFRCVRREQSNQFLYYENATKRLTYIVSLGENGNRTQYIEFNKDTTLTAYLSINYSENGNISSILRYDDSKCPSIYFERTFANDTILVSSTQELNDNTVLQQFMNNKGKLTATYLFSTDRKTVTYYRYKTKNGKVCKKKALNNNCGETVLVSKEQLLSTKPKLHYGQAKDSDQFMFESEVMIFGTKDTIRITYDLDSLEILYSNFGGCGGGAVYSIICHSDSLLTRGSQPSCDELLMEYSYSKEGIVEFVIDSPGIYSVMFFVKNQDQKEVEESRFNHTLSTPKFEVITK